jgi:hypothetical protein
MKRIEVDGDVHRAIERQRRGASESESDILRRVLALAPPASRPAVVDPPLDPPGTRRRGLWTVEIEGEKIPAANLKSAYRILLQALSERCPDFLDEFAEEKGRSRRYVARSPALLYPASPHLAKRHAEALAPGWYFDSNLSAARVSRLARIAARICGLRYGRGVRILDNLREI